MKAARILLILSSILAWASSLDEVVCPGFDMRNDPTAVFFDASTDSEGSENNIYNCTVVEGNVRIILMTNPNITNQGFKPFTRVREITGSLLVYQIKGLRSIGTILPNLRVIGGRNLISNYALVIFQNQDMEEIDLPHIREIRRGGVRIQNNGLLCGAEKTNWSAITRGDSLTSAHSASNVPVLIVVRDNAEPNKCAQCKPSGDSEKLVWEEMCEVNYAAKKREFACLTPTSCQMKCSGACGRTGTGKPLGGCEDLNPDKCCHPECAGGCTGPGPRHCFACRHVYEKGECIPACPPHLFLINDRRCITEKQCLNHAELPQYIRGHGVFKPLSFAGQTSVCTTTCPKKFMEDPKNPKKCILCNGECKKRCRHQEAIVSIQGLEDLKNCEIVEGNLTLQLTGIRENLGITLEECLGEILEVEGYISITYNPLITSLAFFKKLTRIGSTALFKGRYALRINENENLAMLFPANHPKITLGNGTFTPSIHVHNNPMLCYNQIIETARNNSWIGKTEELDPDEVSRTSNGDKTVCVNAEMILSVSVDADTAVLNWEPFNDSEIDHRNFIGYKLYYKELGEDEVPDMFRGNDACSDTWNMRFLQNDERGDIIYPLKPDTRYAFYIRTSVSHHQGAKGAISKIKVTRTLFYTPSAPIETRTIEKEDSIQVHFNPPLYPYGQITHYKVVYREILHKIPDDRNYCLEKPKREEEEKESGTAMSTSGSNETEEVGSCMAIDKGCCPTTASTSEVTTLVDVVDPELRKDDINFENAIHDNVFSKMCDKGKNPSTQLDCRNKQRSRGKKKGSREGDLDEKKKKRKKRAISSQHNLIRKLTTTPPPLRPSPPTPRYSNITDTVFMLHGLPHYTQYRIEIYACQNVSVTPHFCSTDSINILALTLPIKEKDTVRKIWRVAKRKSGENETQTNVEGSHNILIKWEPPEHPNGPILSYTIKSYREDSGEGQGGKECLSRQKYLMDGGFTFANRESGNWSIEVAVESLGGLGPWSSKLFVQVGSQSPFSPLVITLMVAGAALTIAVVAFVATTIAKKHFIKQMPNYIVQFVASNMDYIQTTEVYTKDEWELSREEIQLMEELGAGTFGKVFLGQGRTASGALVHSQNGIDFGRCAVKMVKEGGSPMERLHFLLEANVMKQFDTQFIVKLLGVVSEGQPTLVVMELMEKGNLRDYLRSRRPGAEENIDNLTAPSLTECLQWALMIADGFVYLEARKFVHRDLAARNIMIGGFGDTDVVKIGDFGMARDIYVTDYYRPEGVRKMPVRHMSPESLMDHKFTSKSDVWAYGVVLWEIATQGQQPYMGLGPEEILPYVGRDKRTMPQPTCCPNELYDLMKMCWAYESRHRPSFFSLLNYILRHTTLRPAFKDYFEKVSFFCTADGGGQIDGSATEEEDRVVEDEDGVIGSYTSDAGADSDTPLTDVVPVDTKDSSPPLCSSNRRPGSSPVWHKPKAPSPTPPD